MDAWSGRQTKLAVYDQQENSTTVDVDIKEEQTLILAFTASSQAETTAASYVRSRTKNVAAVRFDTVRLHGGFG